MNGGIAYISIGVSDMDTALDFWGRRLGMEIVAERTGSDESLSRLWNCDPELITSQKLLRTPGADAGMIHLVSYTKAGVPVRAGAVPTDLGPKNLDVNCTDMPKHVTALKADGFTFRSEIGEYTLDDMQAREVQMPGHDDTNIVFIEALSENPVFNAPQSPEGFAGITSFVVAVPDTRPEADFYARMFELEELLHHRISGPEIEAVVGLPPGAALELRMLGTATQQFGRMELVSYEGIDGSNRFERTNVPATGVLSCGYLVSSIADSLVNSARLGAEQLTSAVAIDTILGSGNAARIASPAGMKIDLIEKDAK